MTEAREKTRILALAQPLLHRSGLTTSEIFQKYADLTAPEDTKQGHFFRLLSLLASDTDFPDSQFSRAILRVPSSRKYFQFFLWLCEIYSPPDRTSSPPEERHFDFLRSNKISEFLDSIRKSRTDDPWIVAVFAGAFTSLRFKDWCAAAKDLIASGAPSEPDLRLLRVLCGDREACHSFERTFYDQLWTEIFCGLMHIKCGGSADFSLPAPTDNDWLVTASWTALTEGLESISKQTNIPLVCRVHVACVLGNASEDLLREYIDTLVDRRMLGMVVVYASMGHEDGPVRLLSEVLACLPEPDQKPLEIAKSFGIDPIDLTAAVVDHFLVGQHDIVEGGNLPPDLSERRLAALEWLEKLPGCETIQSEKARRMLRQLVLDGEIDWARKLFFNPKFEAMFSDPALARERKCWDVFFTAESAYDDWKSGIADTASAIEKLTAVLKYPSGWMRECGDDVGMEIGSHCIPFVAKQLHEVLMADKQIDAALGIAALICANGKMLEKYFGRDSLKRFLIDICKASAIAKYSI